MVTILQSQRDRYKERLAVAENTVMQLQQQIDHGEAVKQSLEADNLALYSKIRFLQSYSNSSGSSGSRQAVTDKKYISPKV